MRLIGNKVTERPDHQRISNICIVRSAYMIYHGVRFGILSEERNDSGEFDWVIKIDWDAWERCGKVDVPGVDVDLRLPEYIRRYVPVIVEERTFSDTYEDLDTELERFGLTWNDRFEVMCRNHGRCGTNNILIERCDDREVVK